ncbi:MAG: hypothetical protein IJO71_09440 [Microbacterium sp.]|nr:hypothetical protein [Microbacterium sp.]MBQ9917404.1 hypothetical protein [Microbacterium sp.]
MKLLTEYRDSARGVWKRSAMAWSFDDVTYLNRASGYEKYRIVKVTA